MPSRIEQASTLCSSRIRLSTPRRSISGDDRCKRLSLEKKEYYWLNQTLTITPITRDRTMSSHPILIRLAFSYRRPKLAKIVPILANSVLRGILIRFSRFVFSVSICSRFWFCRFRCGFLRGGGGCFRGVGCWGDFDATKKKMSEISWNRSTNLASKGRSPDLLDSEPTVKTEWTCSGLAEGCCPEEWIWEDLSSAASSLSVRSLESARATEKSGSLFFDENLMWQAKKKHVAVSHPFWKREEWD
jgi:hypothetical protein